MISQWKEKYHHWIPIVHLSFRRLQKEEALKARVVKANETGEKEKVFISRFYLFFWLLTAKKEKKTFFGNWHVLQLPVVRFFPMIYYVQELGAEIAQLEKQRDELEAELKRVILSSIYMVFCFILEVYIHTLKTDEKFDVIVWCKLVMLLNWNSMFHWFYVCSYDYCVTEGISMNLLPCR